MPARLVDKADFERLLGARTWARSAHFAVHHLCSTPQGPRKPHPQPATPELSTGPAPACPQLVDDLPTGWWLGCVVPKRHARRAVTRNLLKRQVRACFERLQAGLPNGLWLVRLRQPFAPKLFPSARSPALQAAARAELEQLLQRRGARSTEAKPVSLSTILTWPRRVLMQAVRGYRLLLKPWLGNACRFEPTCSAYALQALERHGALDGTALTGARILRCHPWCDGGLDPVPENLPRPMAGLFTRLGLNPDAAPSPAPGERPSPTRKLP